jgi:hypothetical protein
MTFVGKLFLMMNLAFSLMMGVAAFGLWANNIDYGPEAKGKTKQAPAKVTATANQIKDLVATRVPVENSWRTARAELIQREQQRQAELVWYNAQLKLLQRGDPARPDVPIQLSAVVLDNKFLPVPGPGPANPLQMAPVEYPPGQQLHQAPIYATRLEAARKDNAAVVAAFQKELTEDQRLTNLLTGGPEKKGLRQQLLDERAKRLGIEAEIAATRPLFINTAVETELVRRRLASLQDRIVELKTYLRTKHKLDVAMRSR